ncbi:poly [adp-ribose] polymerase [Anaeramoeba ignava]|uniref:Poly [adp-ribose] polymerase n=1 Tax=Anaeramoeba ignava TaxID=1746090 RepID=A0A9Q0LB74_ANAIG|nr:poly [adp-ribose] polymerase [Anaeramoeba ignava]
MSGGSWCEFLVKEKWCHKWEHVTSKNYKTHPPRKILCLNMLKNGKCYDVNCPYQHPNPNNKFYEEIIKQVDPYSKLANEKKKNSFFWCDLKMNNKMCRYYAQSKKCKVLGCFFQHHEDPNYVRKDPEFPKQKLIFPIGWKERKEKRLTEQNYKSNSRFTLSQICPNLTKTEGQKMVGCQDPNCSYSHPNPSLLSTNQGMPSNFLENMKKTTCKYYQKTGYCRDKECPYQHLKIKKEKREKNIPQAPQRGDIQIRFHLCPKLIYQKGNTLIGCQDPNCTFSHPNPSLLSTNQGMPSNFLENMNKEFCPFFGEYGQCKKDHCKFQHIHYKEIPEEFSDNQQSPQASFCPFLKQTGYCRLHNVRCYEEKDRERLVCPFSHRVPLNPEIPKREAKLEEIPSKNPIYIDLEKKFLDRWTYGLTPKVIKIEKIKSSYLDYWFTKRKEYLENRRKQSFNISWLYHGTNEKFLEEIYTKGFHILSNYDTNPRCPKSGELAKEKKTPSLCTKKCKFCLTKHCWNRCHMYGLGLYFTYCSSKSDKYIKTDNSIRKMFVCEVVTGNSFMQTQDLPSPDYAHDWVLPPHSYDSILVPGTGKTSTTNVMNNEIIIFHKFQAIPRYLIHYTR